MPPEMLAESPVWAVGQLISELSVAATAIGIDAATLAVALSRGQTIAQVARLYGVKERRVVRALVSSVLASMADDIQRGDLSGDQLTWLVSLATWRARQQVTTAFPAIQFWPEPSAT
jgi:hypothetical protein